MGQLEKYGLYVLCLLIFLILGVTLWGSGEVAEGHEKSRAQANDLNATPGGTGGPAPAPVQGGVERPRLPDFRALLQNNDAPAVNEAPPKTTPKSTPNEEPQRGQPREAPPAPVADARPTHKVKRGDSFESIALRHFGERLLRVEISRLNPKVDPLRLQLDQEIVLPSQAEVDAFLAARKGGQKAARTGGGSYTIVRGDTLEGIAVRLLGSRRYVKDIQGLNPGLDPSNLKIGTTIRLPAR